MTLKQREDEQAYIHKVGTTNPWFGNKLTVKLTHEQLDLLLRDAFRAGLKCNDSATSIFEQVFGKGGL